MNSMLYLIAILCLSQAASLARLAHAPPEAIGFWRLLFASLAMALIAIFQKELRSVWQDIRTKSLLYPSLSGFFFFLHLWTYKYSAINTTIANCMIIFAINPLFTAAGATVFLKEHFQKKLIFAYILAVFGIYQLVHHNLRFDSDYLWGDISALFSAVLFSAYVLTGRKAREIHTTKGYTFLVYGLASFCFLTLALVKKTELTNYPAQTWMAIAGLVLFPTLLGHALFSYLMKHMNLNWMSCGKLIEPVLSSIVAIWLFQENLTTSTWIAFGFTSISVLILFSPWEKMKRSRS
ncbi:MAG: permease [Oligoflexia bacterium]|nr:MAG: permease [Oligoflexia bacterium]